MKAELRDKVHSGLNQIEAIGGAGTAAMLCNLPGRLVLARGTGAPVAQARADGLARQAMADMDDPIMEALFCNASADGEPAVARRLTEADGCTAVARVPGCDEGVVLCTGTTPDARRILDRTEQVLGLLQADAERVA